MKRKTSGALLAAILVLCLGTFGEAGMSSEEFIELCGRGTPSEIRAAIESGADVNARAKQDGMSPLHVVAANNPNPEATIILLKGGANIKARDEHGLTPLHYAATRNPNTAVTIALLESGANVDSRSGSDTANSTPLHLAAQFNTNPEVIIALLKAGANWTLKDKIGATAFALAKGTKLEGSGAFRMLQDGETGAGFLRFFEVCRKGTPAEIRTAINEGAFMFVGVGNEKGETALHYAAQYNPDPEAIRVLLKAGAGVNAKTREKNALSEWERRSGNLTPLHVAVMNDGGVEVVKALLEAGADPNARSEFSETPLHWAFFTHSPHEESVALLLKAGAQIEARNSVGSTPLHVAAQNSANSEVILLLLKAGADGRAKDGHGRKPIDFAENNEKLKDTEAFWALHDASF